MRSGIIDAFAGAEIDVTIVWIPMLDTDDGAAVARAAEPLAAPGVRQYFDADRAAGWAFARGADPRAEGPAWDIYYFYDGAASWSGDDPPAAVDVIKQIDTVDDGHGGQLSVLLQRPPGSSPFRAELGVELRRRMQARVFAERMTDLRRR